MNESPKFVNTIEGIYADMLHLHPYCDVYWQYKSKWLQVLMVAPLFDGEQLYKIVSWDGEKIERYHVLKSWYCTVLWYGD